jgi:hypothetical protein
MNISNNYTNSATLGGSNIRFLTFKSCSPSSLPSFDKKGDIQ